MGEPVLAEGKIIDKQFGIKFKIIGEPYLQIKAHCVVVLVAGCAVQRCDTALSGLHKSAPIPAVRI